MQEQEEQDRGQNDTGQNAAPGIIDGGLDECAGVGEPDQLHSGRQFPVPDHGVEAVADSVDDLDGVGLALFDDPEAGGGFAVDVGFAADLAAHEFDIGHIAQIDAFVFKFADFESLDLFEILEIAVEGDIFLAFVELDSAERLADIVLLQLADDVVDRQVHRGEFFPVEQHMDLHFVGTVDADFADAGNRGETVCDHIIGIVVKIILRAVADEEDLGHRCGIGVDFTNGRLFCSVREVLPDSVQGLPDVGCRHIDVDAHVEFKLDSRFVFDRNAGDMFDSVERGDRILDAFCDLDLNFRRTCPFIFAAHQHRRDLHIGQEIDADPGIETDSDHHQNDNQSRHRNRPLNRPSA